MPTLSALQAAARRRFAEAGIASAALDARLLMQQAAGLDAAQLIASGSSNADPVIEARFAELVQRRLAREPVSKILGVREFYGRPFKVSEAVLDPRPDSEALVDLCLGLLPAQSDVRILDLGTGSGILLLTLIAERHLWSGVGIDLSEAALGIARDNANMLGLADRAAFARSNWFEAVSGSYDLIVSNPPYIETGVIGGLEPEVRDHEPRLALDGGADGLDAYRVIAAGVSRFLAPGGHVAVEVGEGQPEAVSGLFRAAGFEVKGQRTDLSGKVRALAFNGL